MKFVKIVDSQKFFSHIAGGSINSHNHIVKFVALISTKVDTHILNILTQAFQSWAYIHQKHVQQALYRIQSSIIHNIAELKTTQMLTVINNLWYIHTMVKVYNKENEHTAICPLSENFTCWMEENRHKRIQTIWFIR